jgi:hypothetical protein
MSFLVMNINKMPMASPVLLPYFIPYGASRHIQWPILVLTNSEFFRGLLAMAGLQFSMRLKTPDNI